jgi:hypothetical protein
VVQWIAYSNQQDWLRPVSNIGYCKGYGFLIIFGILVTAVYYCFSGDYDYYGYYGNYGSNYYHGYNG